MTTARIIYIRVRHITSAITIVLEMLAVARWAALVKYGRNEKQWKV